MRVVLVRLRWALAWALLILVLCLMPGSALPAWHWADIFSVDKLVHAALFAVLAWLTSSALGVQAGSTRVLWALSAVIAYGGLLEIMQMLPALGRRGDWNDAAANTIGAMAGWGWHRWRDSRKRAAPISLDA